MQATLVTFGVAIVAAAIVGGGLKAAGNEIPVIPTVSRQVLLGLFGGFVLVMGLTSPWDPAEPTTSTTLTPVTETPSTTAVVPESSTATTPSSVASSTPTTGGAAPDVWDAGQAGADSGLVITVNQVRRESDGTLTLLTTVSNDSGDSVTLPLFGAFLATDDTGRASGADPFASDWPTSSIASGRSFSGEIRLESALSDVATMMSLDFSIFGSFRIDAVRVEGVPIR